MTDFSIKKLSNNNFDTWYNSIKNVCRSKGCLEILSKELQPNERLTEEDDKNMGLAMHIINSSLNEQDESYIKDCKTPYEMIEQLKNLKNSNEKNIYELKLKMEKTYWCKGESAVSFINRIKDLKTKIKNINPIEPDSNFIIRIYDQIPNYLVYSKASIGNKIKDESLDFDDVCATIIQEYNEKEYTQRKLNYVSTASSSPKSGKWCNVCKMKNHNTEECTKNKSNVNQQQTNNNSNIIPRKNSNNTSRPSSDYRSRQNLNYTSRQNSNYDSNRTTYHSQNNNRIRPTIGQSLENQTSWNRIWEFIINLFYLFLRRYIN